MKKVISGHVCNTETAKKVGSNQSETLYVTRAGVYFICSNTGDISTLSKDDAQRWTESSATDEIKHFASENNLKSLRRAARLTQRQLADAAGIFVTQVQKLESGEAKIENLRWHTVLSLSDALGVSADKLRSKNTKTPDVLTIISTFSDFLKYTGITQSQIKKDWKISVKEMHKWIDDETSIPAWVIPMLVELYNVSDRVEYHPLGSAIII